MKTIALVRFAQSFGGIEHQIINVVSSTYKKYKYILIINKESEFTKEFRKFGKVYVIGTTKLFAARKKILEIIKKENINILQSHMLREHYICCLCKRKIKKIYHIFRVHTYIDCSYIKKYKKNLYHILSYLLGKYVDLYLPITKMNYNELINRSKLKKEKIVILHDGVRDMSRAASETKYNYYDLVMIANLIYGKGHDVAIRALAKLIKVNKRYNITFIGATDVENNNPEYSLEGFKKMAAELKVEKNIQFVGYKKDIAKELKNRNILILPSYSEGTPNCLLEAMSAKKIIVASAVGGIPEFIKNNENGFLHHNKNYKELSDIIIKIKDLPTSKLKKISENGYNTWHNEYSIEKICHDLEKIYNEVT